MHFSKAIFLFLISPILLFHPSEFEVGGSVIEDQHEPEFSYNEATGRGPSRWGLLHPNWKACGDGKLQSPVDLPGQVDQAVPSDFHVCYQPTLATIKSLGHAILVSWKGNAGFINIDRTDYQLISCHWHLPTEHAIQGTRYDLEFHILHQNPDGKTAVVGFLYKLGVPDPFLARLLPFIKSVTKEEKDVGILNPNEIGFLPRNYYRYIGSFTTPPCTEDVVWTVFQEVREASVEQVEALRNAVDAGYEENARPIQTLNG